MASEAAATLAALLTEYKERSGLSYEQLGRKVHSSRSTVHRYCTGRNVPTTFAPIEAIATVCGASREDLAKLYRVWERADLGETPVPEPVVIRDTDVAETARARPLSRVALVVVLGVVLFAGGAMANPPDRQAQVTAPAVQAAMWTNAPRALDPEFVGVTTNSNTGLMPTFRVGSVRLWNTRTRWQNLEPARGRHDWTTLERLVTSARGAGFPVSLTFGGTPSWASPNSPKSVYTDDSRTGPPDDLADWDRFVRAVVERYRGRIDAYELWDMANHQDFFSGSMAGLVEMTRRASQVIKSADPAATVVCPSMGELWDPGAFDGFRRFAKLGGYDHCDAAAMKLAPRNDSDPPETMLPLAQEIEKVLHEAGAADQVVEHRVGLRREQATAPRRRPGCAARCPVLPFRPLRAIPPHVLLQLGQRQDPHRAAARRMARTRRRRDTWNACTPGCRAAGSIPAGKGARPGCPITCGSAASTRVARPS